MCHVLPQVHGPLSPLCTLLTSSEKYHILLGMDFVQKNNKLVQPGQISHQIPPHIASKFPGYKLQVYDIDGGNDYLRQ